MPKSLTKPFLLILVLLVLVGCYFIFRPFLTELFVAAILVSIFYRPYEWLTSQLKSRPNVAAMLMCLFLVVVIVVPTIRIIAYAGQKSVSAYSQAVIFFNENDITQVLEGESFQKGVLKYLRLDSLGSNNYIKDFFLDILKKSSNWMLSGATIVVRETTSFVVSLFLIIVAMFFFFVDGKRMLKGLMYLSPLPNHYDKEIFAKFRAVSYTTFVSTFVTAIAQGVVGAIGFAVVGFPALLAGVLVALLSLLPYLGSMIFYVPVGLYYLLIGEIWQGIFVLLWGLLIIGTIDNLIRAYMIKGKAQVNPVFILFSILGGIALFGFWGVAIGPLIVALTVTIFHIYQMEFCSQLENCDAEDEEGESKKKKSTSKHKN